MIKTAIITVPILSTNDNNVSIKIDAKVDLQTLQTLLNDGYRIKIVNDILYHDVMFAHYILEKEE